MKPTDWQDIQATIQQWAQLPENDRPDAETIRKAVIYAADCESNNVPLPDSVCCIGGEITFESNDPRLKLVTFTADGGIDLNFTIKGEK